MNEKLLLEKNECYGNNILKMIIGNILFCAFLAEN